MPTSAFGTEQAGFEQQDAGALAMQKIQQQIQFLPTGFFQLERLVVGLFVDQLQQQFLLHLQAGLICGFQQAAHSVHGSIHTGDIPATFAEPFDLSDQVADAGLAACMVHDGLASALRRIPVAPVGFAC